MNVDFVEIGTSNFDTLLQESNDTQIGFSVEPILYYLNSLPNKKNVTKVNAAITTNKKANTIEIYYIPEDVCDKHKLPSWFKGCNSIGKYHPYHISHNVTEHVVKEHVRLMNIDEFLKLYNIKRIKYLKIDTEGHDIIILNGLFDYVEKLDRSYYPLKILFETNSHTPKEDVDAFLDRVNKLGYKLIYRNTDTLIELTKKYAIVQYDNRNIDQYMKLMNINKKYCRDHNYDYIFSSDKYDMPVYWIKVKLVLDLLNTNKYDGILWLDSDAVIYDIKNPLDDIIIPNKSMYICPDNHKFAEFTSLFNAGVWFVLNTNMGKMIMTKWMEYYNKIKNNWKLDANGKYYTNGKWAGSDYEQGSFVSDIMSDKNLSKYIEKMNYHILQAVPSDIGKYSNIKTLHFAPCKYLISTYTRTYSHSDSKSKSNLNLDPKLNPNDSKSNGNNFYKYNVSIFCSILILICCISVLFIIFCYF